MSCMDALIPNVITISTKTTVDEAIRLIIECEIRAVPVLDNHKKFVGLFGLHSLMDDLLPVAARLEDGIEDLGFVIDGAPGAAKRIRKLGPQPAVDHVDPLDEHILLTPDIHMLEVIRRLSKYGSPLPVVGHDGTFVGLVSDQSCLSHLRSVLQNVEAEEKKIGA